MAEIVANVSKLIFVVAVATMGIATPALAAHKAKIIYVHQNRSLAGSGRASAVNFNAGLSSTNDPASRPYHYDPGLAPNGQ